MKTSPFTIKRLIFFCLALIVVIGALFGTLLWGTVIHTGPGINAPALNYYAFPLTSITSQGRFGGYLFPVPGAPSTQILQSSPPGGVGTQTQPPSLSFSTGRGSGYVEFFSNITVSVNSTIVSMNRVSNLVASLGGYIAYSSYSGSSAVIVARVPYSQYPTALSEIESVGTLVSSSSTSNDVTMQYTDLNATLQALLAERTSLLGILNQTKSVNETLQVESQITGVNVQINEVESQILSTKLLIDYSTITVTIIQSQTSLPLTLKVTALPTSGESPLSVTFATVVGNSSGNYIVNFNFGDGTSAQGTSLIHTFVGSGRYNVTVTVSDLDGRAVTQSLIIRVTGAPGGFLGSIYSLFIGVLEGIASVAVVGLPILGLALLIYIPIRSRRNRNIIPKAQRSPEERITKP